MSDFESGSRDQSLFFFSIQIRIFVQSGSNLFLYPDQNSCAFQFQVVVGGGPYALMLWVAVPSLLILILNLVGGGPYASYIVGGSPFAVISYS